jgi:signal transduction histidine kinase
MHERAQTIGAHLEIVSAAGEGVRVRLTIPAGNVVPREVDP